jgi:hypothetical protein
MRNARDHRRPTRFASLPNPGRYFLALAAVLLAAAALGYALQLL